MTVHILSNDEGQTYLDLGITPNDLVRFRWPDATDEEAAHILWEYTPWPMVQGFLDIADAIAEIDVDCMP